MLPDKPTFEEYFVGFLSALSQVCVAQVTNGAATLERQRAMR